MISTRMPAFTAEASLEKSPPYGRVRGTPATRVGREARIELAARRHFFCGLKECCIDLRDHGLGAVCCDRSGGGCYGF
jgi:hypothetical protein